MTDKEAEKLLENITAECKRTGMHQYRADGVSEFMVDKHLPVDQAARNSALVYFGHQFVAAHQPGTPAGNFYGTMREKVILLVLGSTVHHLHTFSDEEFHSLIGNWHEVMKEDHFWFSYPNEKIADQVFRKIQETGITELLKQTLRLTKYRPDLNNTKDRRKFNDRIDLALQDSAELPVNRQDPVGQRIADFVGSIEDPREKERWKQLVQLCYSAQDKSAPPKKWLGDVGQIMSKIDTARFVQKMMEWLGVAKTMLSEAHRSSDYRKHLISENVQELLKALIWCTAFANSPELIDLLDDYAAWAYRKLPLVGPLSAKTGTACMYAFSLLPGKEGISKLVKFRSKIKNNTILKGIDKIIREVAEKNKVSLDELEEMSVPDFGLDSRGVLRKPMGEFVAVYSMDVGAGSQLVWEKDGKVQKAVPASVKAGFDAGLKSLKNTIKEIESLLPVYKEKLEQSYLRQKTWDYRQWKTNYLDHPLMGILARKLIWHFSNSRLKTQGIWLNDRLVDVDENVLDLDEEDTEVQHLGEATEGQHPDDATEVQHLNEATGVQLWHPIGFGAERIAAWRNFLQKHRITQPFKQAYREIYLVTDAELATDVYSNRFAAHILRQHQFAALCKQRGWKYRLMGAFDSCNTPDIMLEDWNIRVEYHVDADWQSETSGMGIFMYIATDQVRFSHYGQRLRMSDVPALVFTEVMRDIDLFVGVCSIGNDPAWRDGGGGRGGGGDQRANAYWHNYSFGDLSESAKIREEVLKGLIPRLRIAAKCSFDGRYLRVQGKLRSYKIHLGSGNILMDPDDRYLCIVPDRSYERSTDKLFLPFEGDMLLSIILSKALLLADDDKITDETILRQIRG